MNHELLIASLLAMLYSIIDGWADGYYWHTKSPSKDTKLNVHKVFAARRAVVLLALIAISPGFCWGGWLWIFCDVPWIIVTFPLMFSFLHNGAYYTTRNRLSEFFVRESIGDMDILLRKISPYYENMLNMIVYPKKWWDQSTTSTAWWTKHMTPRNRTTLFIIGLILTIYLIIKT